ncbi:MAG: hypothetical protein ABJL43_01230 [Maribacter dokdonensis]|uniref:hypothetical protein n=1 Tax=Maribacter dokdonensis TaxID=320912 RepID=UPI0032987B1E
MDKKWNITDNRIVLYLDIMGFKDLVQKTNPEILHKYLKDAIQFASQMKHLGYADLEKAGLKIFPEIKSQVFSDSIIFTTQGITPADIYIITKGAKWVSSVLFQHHITFRGAIAVGNMTYDEDSSIFFGQPLIDAYQLEQQLDLFGIAVHHSFEGLLKHSFKQKKCQDSLQDYIPYAIRTTKGKAKHLVLDWIKFAEEIHGNTFHEQIYSILSCQMSGGPKHYLDNTYNFFKECLNRTIIDRHDK